MAFAWIEKITNISGSEITLLQEDPTYHPVINGEQFKNREIHVPPGTKWDDVRWFAVPWQKYGKLTISGPKGGAEMVVGPIAGDTNDYLRGGGQAIKLGPPGDFHAVGDVAFELLIGASRIDWLPIRVDAGLKGFIDAIPAAVWEALAKWLGSVILP